MRAGLYVFRFVAAVLVAGALAMTGGCGGNNCIDTDDESCTGPGDVLADAADATDHTDTGDDAADAGHVDLSTLDADAVVLATSYAGGFLPPGPETFFNSRHGTNGLFVFGDGRYISLKDYVEPFNGYRSYREGTLPTATLQELVDRAAGLTAADSGDYTVCEVLDAGTEYLVVNIPGLAVEASAYPNFIHDCGMPATGPQPGANLVALASAMSAVDVTAATEMVTNRIVLGGFDGSSWGGDCTTETAVEWTFDNVSWPEDATDIDVVVNAPDAAAIRTFLRAGYEISMYEWGTVCVARYGKAWQVFYDDMPDEDELLPL